MFSSKTIRCLKLEGLIAVFSLLHKIPFKHEFSKAITELVKISRNFNKILEKKSLYYRAFFNIQAGGGGSNLVPRLFPLASQEERAWERGWGKCPPPVPPCAPPPRNHILPPQEKSLFPKIIQTNQRRITNR